MNKKTPFLILGMLLLLHLSMGCKSSKPILVKGTIGNRFHLSNTNELEEDQRAELQERAKQIEGKMKKLDRYYSYLVKGKKWEAEKIIRSDEELSKLDDFDLSVGYSLVKMEELGILYDPLILCNEHSPAHIISLSESDLKALDPYLNQRKEVQLTIQKIGFLEMDSTTVYKLIEIHSLGQ